MGQSTPSLLFGGGWFVIRYQQTFRGGFWFAFVVVQTLKDFILFGGWQGLEPYQNTPVQPQITLFCNV